MSEDKRPLASAQSILDLMVEAGGSVKAGNWSRTKYEEACAGMFLVWVAAAQPSEFDEEAWDAFFEVDHWLLDQMKAAGCIRADLWEALRDATPVWGLKEKGKVDG